MRILLQRVSRAEVRIHLGLGNAHRLESPGESGTAIVAAGRTDSLRHNKQKLHWMSEKIQSLRLFQDSEGRMNRDLREHGGAVLVVSQFTLYGDARKGRRPSFIAAAQPNIAASLYEHLIELLRSSGLHVETGEFGASMDVELVNDGPVTLWLEREARGRSQPR